MPSNAKNVLGGPLQTCSTSPMTGFYRDGCCNTGADDEGLHTICCQVTAEFLAHQKSIGNDLSTPFPVYGFPGLRPADRWCVCITRWKQSLEAGFACPVVLEATHMHALEYVDLEDLQRHAVSIERKSLNDRATQFRRDRKMRLDDAPESSNVQDRRGMGAPLAVGGGVGGVLLVILGLVFGVDLGGGRQAANPGGGLQGDSKKAPQDGYKQFSAKVLGMTEEVWKEQFKTNGYKAYKPPEMVLFSQGVSTGCGNAPSSVGPFYCPADQKVYLDPTFFDELETKLGGSKAPFSQAYVIGHEVGHHVQNLLGYSARTDAKRKGRQENEYSIRLELQADYMAGVWAHHADKKYKILENGDVEAALKTARSIGDNRIQEKMRGKSHPESFNHGTDRQRFGAFSDGLKTGDASKGKLDLYFDEGATPFDARSGELRNSRLFGN